MSELFKIESADVELIWRAPRKQIDMPAIGQPVGRLVAKPRKNSVDLQVWRSEVPESVAHEPALELGPCLFEQTTYSIYVRSKTDKSVQLVHVDPNLCNALYFEDNERAVHGSINFGSEVGFSTFSVHVNNQPEFDFEIEVFPTKLDYKSDYEQIVAETQDYIAGLAFEYLRSTYKLSFPLLKKQSGKVEWLLILKMVLSDLERAAHQIAKHPVRSVVRESNVARPEKIRKVDSFVRSAVQRGGGSGSRQEILSGLHLRQKVPFQKTSFSIDTAEHRWIALRLRAIRDKLSLLRANDDTRSDSARRRRIDQEIQDFESRLSRLLKLEPFKNCLEMPPAGFASLQLLKAPGYRECYNACNLLSLGLQIESGLLNLSLKELSSLYESWCFLTVVHLLAKAIDSPLPVHQLVKATHSGLSIQLKSGKYSAVNLCGADGRKIVISYNREFDNADMLLAQRPDIMVSFLEQGWPALNLLLDAKYRVSFQPEYVKRYGGPGPAIDAVNALHRYRDAILEENSGKVTTVPKRNIIQAAALFPFRADDPDSYKSCSLWKSLDRLGVGAIPLLPGGKHYLEEWLLGAMRSGGWALSDRVLSHTASEHAADWRLAASEPVLVGVLRPDIAEMHLQWILKNSCYFMPLLKNHPRQLVAKWLAIYSPAALRSPGAVTHKAKISSIEVVPRGSVITPWNSSANSEELYAVYHFDSVELITKPIENLNDAGKGERFSTPRWASRLSLERANCLEELLLESEGEWRLYELLKSVHVRFKLKPSSPRRLSSDDEQWRNWFVLESGSRIRYAGSNGYLLEKTDTGMSKFASFDALRAAQAFIG